MKTMSTGRRIVTRQDVAMHAHVSAAVVSYVVNSGPRNVAPATRARVLESIEQLGYRPNAAARALKRGLSETIGLVLSDNANPFFAEFSRAVERAAAARGLAVILTDSALTAGEERRLIGRLISRQVDGLLLAGTGDDPDLSEITAARTSVVLLDRGIPMVGVDSIGVDFRAASMRAVEHLIGHGHRRIALIAGTAHDSTRSLREAGWRDALVAAGLPEGPIVRVPFSRAGGYDAGRQLLSGGHPPEAVYAMSDIQAIGLLRALHEGGVGIPEQTAVVSFDGSIESEYSWPGLTSMRQPVSAMAEAAIETVLGRRDGPPSHRVFPAELVIRGSCGCTPA